jgi:hypothetical protein
VQQAPQDGDELPPGAKPPQGFYPVTGDDGKQTLRHNTTAGDVMGWLSDLPGVGMAERIGQGATRLAGKAVSGVAGAAAPLFGGDAANTVAKVQGAVNNATELPPSNDPIVQAAQGVTGLVQKGVDATGVENAQGNLSPGLRTTLEGVEEAIPDVASLAPGLAGARATRAAGAASKAAPIASSDVESALKAVGYNNLPRQAADSTATERVGASIAGEGPLSQQQTLTNQGVHDQLASHEAGVPNGQELNYRSLAQARAAGPAKVYDAAHDAMPPQFNLRDPTDASSQQLLTDINTIGDTTSQLPRSPDVDQLKETMLSQPQMTRDQLFANIQQSRERASRFYAAEQPDSEAMGDAYSALANAYEDFVGRNLQANPQAGVSLQDWQGARTAFAKNYTVQSALKGTSVQASKIAALQQKNPTQLTGGLQLIAEQHNRFPLSSGFGPTTLAPDGIGASGTLPGMMARHVTGPALGAATGFALGGGPAGAAAGGAAGLLGSQAMQAVLRRWLGGNPEAAQAAARAGPTNPALGYHFGGDEPMPPGWNRSEVPPSPQAPPLALPAPNMVNAGGGVTTPNILQELGLSPDVQAAGPQHPGAARAAPPAPPGFAEQVPARPMERLDFQPPQNWSQNPVLAENGLPPAAARRFGGPGLADVLSSNVPDNIAARTAPPGGAPLFEALNRTPDQLDDELAALAAKIGNPVKRGGASNVNNASGQTAVSQEFANAQAQDRAAGVTRSIVDPDGNGMQIHGVAARDLGIGGSTAGAPVPRGHIAVEERPGQRPTILSRGGLSPQAANGLMNRWLSMREQPRLGDVFGR